ncbi:MAG: excinuclease ABC subunit A [Candidatus Firestonebacteria bacterium RIFOXYC2_FULL_39_67]|nr:MAG: excinuclease ABC subunit A [Candidatus Firestonebacteria bacterium RIFOXYD2_FULL_39_29]OGF57632.1 MAG: excinuclease ABC subunit A [Candidatus Firestonebacteria bacterium RIFOXYC2_FULL_39_67]
MNKDKLIIKGAREHNLKNISLELPRNKLIVITGLSGSGKSSLAFDTIYAEGQRRYIESLSAYARQFLGQMEKPDVDSIEGLSPAIAIEQKKPSHNPRSTVGTVTEIYDYFRLLFARIGIPYCHKCGKKIERQNSQQIIDQILDFGAGVKIQILSPMVRSRKGEYAKLFEQIKKDGYVRVRVDGKIYDLEEKINLEKTKKHSIEVVIDRLVIGADIKKRLANSVETALKSGDGTVIILKSDKEEILFSEKFACVECGVSMSDLAPRMFSFNSPFGACTECSGLGHKLEIDAELIIPDETISLDAGAIAPWSSPTAMYYKSMLHSVAKHFGIRTDIPFCKLKKEHKDIILYGSGEYHIKFNFSSVNMSHAYTGKYEGVIPNLKRRYLETDSEFIRNDVIGQYMRTIECPACNGARLKPEILSIRLGGKNINELTRLSISTCAEYFKELKLTDKEKKIAEQIFKEVTGRLKFLFDVGLSYLTLDRAASTLSGGEAQRIHLATQIGSSLVGVLYILDEPSIGLHQKDNAKLLQTLKKLRDLGNTVIVVEHDEDTMREADYLVDLGPGAGENGGYIVAAGKPEEVIKNKNSITGSYLRGDMKIEVPKHRNISPEKYIELKGVTTNNLKNIDVKFPAGCMTCITGVSGSGKSSLIEETLYPSLIHEIFLTSVKPGGYKKFSGIEFVDRVINIDQTPIGRTPRSNPATYTGVFTLIRDLFASTIESKSRGYQPGRFSFNVKGGRCEACEGDGIIKIEMHFLPDVYVPCEVCKSKRYNRETLEVMYKGKTISDVLELTVEDALKFFENIPKVKKVLETLNDVGLGYIKLGQSATTLSGGEAQRIKLSAELSKRATGKTIYILDEPTTGLHFDDIKKLLEVLFRLRDMGNTVIVIEHNLDVIKTADYIIDLGPEGGDKGGELVATGSPEDIVKSKSSYTGYFLKKILN